MQYVQTADSQGSVKTDVKHYVTCHQHTVCETPVQYVQTADSQGSVKTDVEHYVTCHQHAVCDRLAIALFISCRKLPESVRIIYRVVWPSILTADQGKSCEADSVSAIVLNVDALQVSDCLRGYL